jgi:predicted Zn-dependent peptidase
VWSKTLEGQLEVERWTHLSGGSAYPFSPAGQKKSGDLDDLTLERFAASVMQPRDATVVLLSDADPKTARAAVEAGPLPNWKPRPPPATPAPWPWPEPLDRQVIVAPRAASTAQASVSLSCRIERSSLALTLVQKLIEQRLTWQLRATMGATYSVGAQLEPEPWGRSLRIASDIDTRAVGTSVKRILGVLDDVTSGKVSPAELDRIKLTFARETAFAWQTTAGLASWYGSIATAGLPPDTVYNLADALHAVTVQDLQDALSGCVGKEIITVLGEGERVTEALDAAGVSHRVLEQADE